MTSSGASECEVWIPPTPWIAGESIGSRRAKKNKWTISRDSALFCMALAAWYFCHSGFFFLNGGVHFMLKKEMYAFFFFFFITRCAHTQPASAQKKKNTGRSPSLLLSQRDLMAGSKACQTVVWKWACSTWPCCVWPAIAWSEELGGGNSFSA